MLNKSIYKMIWFLVLISSVNKIPATGAENTNPERAFYAVSSLSYCLDSKNAESFSDEEIQALWETASIDPTFLPEINKAQQYYLQAKSNQSNSDLFRKSKQIVSKVWKEMGDCILSKYVEEERRLRNNLESIHPNIQNNPCIEENIRIKIEPHLLPLDHPMHASLEEIFKKSRAIRDEEAFAQAGFKTLFVQKDSLIRVAQHDSLPGYLLKIYLDNEKGKVDGRPGWLSLTNRCIGAANIRSLIQRKNFRHFVVPDKFIYPLPPNPPPKKRFQQVILIVTDMNIYNREESEVFWKTVPTKAHIDELYSITSHGYGSIVIAKNIPYTKSGKFSCIDTEKPIKKVPRYDKIKSYLSPEMQVYWDKLVKTGGKGS